MDSQVSGAYGQPGTIDPNLLFVPTLATPLRAHRAPSPRELSPVRRPSTRGENEEGEGEAVHIGSIAQTGAEGKGEPANESEGPGQERCAGAEESTAEGAAAATTPKSLRERRAIGMFCLVGVLCLCNTACTGPVSSRVGS